MTGRIIYSFCALACIVFGLNNLYRFKQHILPHSNLMLFYLFSILCVIMTIVQCWMNVLQWYKLSWMIINGVVRTTELCFIWCQTITFLLLSYRLSAQEKSGLSLEKGDESQKQVVKRFNRILVAGLVGFTAFLVLYIIFFLDNTQWGEAVNTDKQKSKYVIGETLFLVTTSCTQVTLIFSITYTIWRLNALFPGANFNEHRNKIVSIAILFCISIVIKTIYEWFMYYQHKLQH